MISVVCAVIEHEGKILATQRSFTMSQPWLWEFPGGKIEKDETAEQALIREIREELNIEIQLDQPLTPVEHTYESFSIRLIPFTCKFVSGQLQLREHMAYQWLKPYELHQLRWAPADLPIVDEVGRLYGGCA